MTYSDSFSANFQHSPIHHARFGTIATPHGNFPTPNFIFCGTKASIKGIPSQVVRDAGAEIILANTYHLVLNPGAEYIAKRGGLHSFMNWDGPLLTDSGGYQVFAMGHGSVSSEIKKGSARSLPKSLLSISEEGVSFRSYYDGSLIFLSPELATHAQQLLGADIIMQFDECTPFHVDKKYTEESMRRSVRWGDRCLDEMRSQHISNQVMYGIIQGGIYKDLREESIGRLSGQEFWGLAIGGSLGEHRAQMHEIVAMNCELLRNNATLSPKPLHLLGVGEIEDIFWGVRNGIDSFDCVHPTRIARHAHAIVPADINPNMKLNLRNAQHAKEDYAIDPLCKQICCTHYSRAYIHYLFKAKELLSLYLLSVHNIAQMSRLMQEIQDALTKDQETQEDIHLTSLEKFWTQA